MCVSGRYLDRMVAEEVSEGIASTRVAIAGFSQVGITAYTPFASWCTSFMSIYSSAYSCQFRRLLAGMISMSIYTINLANI